MEKIEIPASTLVKLEHQAQNGYKIVMGLMFLLAVYVALTVQRYVIGVVATELFLVLAIAACWYFYSRSRKTVKKLETDGSPLLLFDSTGISGSTAAITGAFKNELVHAGKDRFHIAWTEISEIELEAVDDEKSSQLIIRTNGLNSSSSRIMIERMLVNRNEHQIGMLCRETIGSSRLVGDWTHAISRSQPE